MMQLKCIGHDFSYDINNILNLFEKPVDTGFQYVLETKIEAKDTVNYIDCILKQDDQIVDTLNLSYTMSKDVILEKKQCRTKLKLAVYDLMIKHYQCYSKWGILVGIRPVKIVHELIDRGLNEEEMHNILEHEYRVEKSKRDLIIYIAKKERAIIFPVEEDKISLYICIPFCPSRCLYCSFPSNDLKKKKKLIEPYVDLLLQEIDHTIEKLKADGKTIDCVYIGGGTPTSLNEEQLLRLLSKLDEKLDLKALIEFTVEAGRPDTITEEKLQMMHDFHVDRICINPQSMNQKTLNYIGRNHSVEDIEAVYHMARKIGFKSINMDLIIGLPTEGIKEVEQTLNRVKGLAPENITLHTLAIKRSSRLNEFINQHELEDGDSVEEMMAYAKEKISECNVSPYYMYRQKKMLGNLENIGYAKTGLESIYNMRIMEERHTIIALGAGAVSKICTPKDNKFERVANFKGVEDYIERFDEILTKK